LQASEKLEDFRSVNGKSPFVCLGPIFQGTGRVEDYDVSVENGYYFHEPGARLHYLFFTGRNVATRPITYLVGYAVSESAFGPYTAVRRLTELEADGVKSLSNVCVVKHEETYFIFHDSVKGYIGTTPAAIRYATTQDLDKPWTPQGIALGTGPKGNFDDNYLIDTRVVWDGEQWRMYYTSPRNCFDTTRAQGCAFSQDLREWRRFSAEPLLDSDIEGLAIFPYAGQWVMLGCGPSRAPGPTPFYAKYYASPDGLHDWRLLNLRDDCDLRDPWPGTFNFNRDEAGLPFVIYSQTARAVDDPQPMYLLQLATVAEAGAELLVAKSEFHSTSLERGDTAEVLHHFQDGRVRWWVRTQPLKPGQYAAVFARRPALQDTAGGARGIACALAHGALQLRVGEEVLAAAAFECTPGEWCGLELEARGPKLRLRGWDVHFQRVQCEIQVETPQFLHGSLALGAVGCAAEFARVELFA